MAKKNFLEIFFPDFSISTMLQIKNECNKKCFNSLYKDAVLTKTLSANPQTNYTLYITLITNYITTPILPYHTIPHNTIPYQLYQTE